MNASAPPTWTASRDAKMTDPDQRKLYDLIWKRTIASQMEAARMERTTVDIASADGQVACAPPVRSFCLTASCKVYEEGRDDQVIDDDDASVCRRSQRRACRKKSVSPEQHFTQPPPRFTEATLVKRMEELGIGRPSTYASIVTTIQDREYVRKEKNRLIPEDKGRLVTAFLFNYFRKYVGYEFTANLEEELDDVSGGRADYKDVLGRFWRDFSAAIAETSELRITEVLEKINEVLEPHLFPPTQKAATRGFARIAARGGFRCAPRARAAPLSDARTIRNAGSRAHLVHPAPQAKKPGRTASCWARMRAKRSRFGKGASALTSSAAKPPTTCQNRRVPRCRRAGPRPRWIWKRRFSFCHCRARSGRIPKTAKWSRPESGAMGLTSNTGGFTRISKKSRTSSPSA